jgi:hypothetical protein
MALTFAPAQSASSGGFTQLPGSNQAVVSQAGVQVASPGDSAERALLGYITITGDGSVKTGTVFYINSATALNYTPTGVALTCIGGTDTVGAAPTAAGVTNTQFTINWSVAIASATTQIIMVELVR